jgi:uncharacterized protein (TIGR02611 family)
MPTKKLKSIAVEVLGWMLVLVGIAALVLPGPGLLALFAGLTLLATRYEWAERRLEPVRAAAFQAARDSVANWRRTALSCAGVAILLACGVIWVMQPSVPDWWQLDDRYWLIGGIGTGITLIVSSLIAAAILAYSFITFRPKQK